ncbi:MAG: hypothetical protein E7376_01075 [Clostridiales bacterium]|nr:hypothetical protein [Clostridiales bacterium]
MKFVNPVKLLRKDIESFISSLLSSEDAVFNNKTPVFKDYSDYIQFSSFDNNGAVIASNFNCGMCTYNIFTLTDFEFYSLYPLCQADYTPAWRNFLSKRFPEYDKELKKYLDNKQAHK